MCCQTLISSPYRRTDLAVEEEALCVPHSGVAFSETNENGISITTVEVKTEEGATHIMRPIGHYITLSFPPFWNEYENIPREALVMALEKTILFLLKKHRSPCRILVVGLGNRAITADAVGPIAAEKIDVTGHWDTVPSLRPYLPPCPLFAISPGVLGKTGIETFTLVKAAVEDAKPSHVIVIDSLAARSTDRLGRCIQLSDTGIVPGSGIGNHRKAIDEKALGVPVIAIGIPLVVSSSTLVWDALEKANVESVSNALKEVLENGTDFFVTLKESDLATNQLADLIATAINACADNIT